MLPLCHCANMLTMPRPTLHFDIQYANRSNSPNMLSDQQARLLPSFAQHCNQFVWAADAIAKLANIQNLALLSNLKLNSNKSCEIIRQNALRRFALM